MPGGRKPDLQRYRLLLRWAEEGKSRKWMAEQLGITTASLFELLRRARNHPGAALDPVVRISNESMSALDQVINERLKVQAAVVKDALASTRDSIAELAMRVRDLAKGQTELLRRLDSLAERPAEVERSADAGPVTPKRKRPSSETPTALWLWIVNECVRQIGMAGVVDQLEVTESLVNQWLRGTTPSSRHRDDLKRLLATIWARDDLFDDLDDLLDARDRLPTAQNAEAT